MKKVLLFSAVCLLFCGLVGCASLVEDAKGVAGLSTKNLEELRKEAIAKTFHYTYKVCLEESKKALQRMGAYIYAEDQKKQMIAVYLSNLDTTPVGIFFKAVDDNNTQVEVSSPSSYGKEYISEKLFFVLEKPFKQQEKEEKADDKKEPLHQ